MISYYFSSVLLFLFTHRSYWLLSTRYCFLFVDDDVCHSFSSPTKIGGGETDAHRASVSMNSIVVVFVWNHVYEWVMSYELQARRMRLEQHFCQSVWLLYFREYDALCAAPRQNTFCRAHRNTSSSTLSLPLSQARRPEIVFSVPNAAHCNATLESGAVKLLVKYLLQTQ